MYAARYVNWHTMRLDVRRTKFSSSVILADAIITELLAKKHHSSYVNLAVADLFISIPHLLPLGFCSLGISCSLRSCLYLSSDSKSNLKYKKW